MKNKLYVMVAGLMLIIMAFPSYVQASDGEEYITISVDAVDDNTNLQYALDSDDPSAFKESNEFTVPAGTSHTIYVKDAAGNIASQRYEPEHATDEESYRAGSYEDFYEDEEEQQINIDLELGRKETEEALPEGTGNPGTASISSRTKTDGTVDGEKVFYTFTTKEGEELYLVVDQGRGTDNVYLLDTVSLADLRVLADNSGTDTTMVTDSRNEDNLLSILAEENEALEEPEALQKEGKTRKSFGNNLVILFFAGIGAALYYYIKIYRNKRDEAMDAIDAMDMDEFEPEDEEELEFDYDEEEKEKFLESLINGDAEEETFFDQDPNAYATSHTSDEFNEDDADEDSYGEMEINF